MCLKIDSFVIANKQVGNIAKNSVGVVKALNGKFAMVLFIGVNELKKMKYEDLESIDIYKTGKGFDVKICNICHILKNTSSFEINQTDAKGNKTTRPSCRECRKQIDGIKLSVTEKKRMDKFAPPKGSVFTCPICEKRSIVGITANLVRDHNHETGEGREWICDSCNTGFLEKVIEYLKQYEK